MIKYRAAAPAAKNSPPHVIGSKALS
jgi:hypothetical protein